MCGICGYIGYDNSFEYGYLGILKLLNRGYDSVGITTIENTNEIPKFLTHKYASDNNEFADSKIFGHQSEHKGTICIVHSRWRTVGAKTNINSHPHNDMYDKFSLVHNGIIENYIEMRNYLIKNGYEFKSETDTEVIVNLISYYYTNDKLHKNNPKMDIEQKIIFSIKSALADIEGTYALGILCIDAPDNMFCVRHGSPLLIGMSQNDTFMMISSECYGFDSNIIRYISVDNNDIITLSKINDVIILNSFDNKVYQPQRMITSCEHHSPEPYDYWTLKEINDQVTSCTNAIGMGRRIIDNYVKLGGLEKKTGELLDVKNIILLGCGTSFNSGLLGTYLFKNICNFNSVSVYDGANFNETDLPKFGKTCVIFISQSGETKDLHRCLELCKSLRLTNKADLINIGVINVIDSLIAREVDCGVYLNCGREIAVASTKAFSSQIIVLTLIAIWYAQHQNINPDIYSKYINKILKLHYDIKMTIDMNTEKCKEIAQKIKNKHSLFILGRDEMECVSKEGSLKMKEIGYIHAEGYNSSALKHGPYALLDDKFPVILLIPNDKNLIRNKGILDELKSRESYVIGISDEKISEKFDELLIIPNNSYTEICTTVILQMIAYYLAIEKNINPDFPRHIAKVLSVD